MFFAPEDLSLVLELTDSQFKGLEVSNPNIETWTSNGVPSDISLKRDGMMPHFCFHRIPHHYYGHTYTRRSLDLLNDLEAGVYGSGFGVEKVRII